MTRPDLRSTRRRRFNPDGIEPLVSAAGLVLLVLSVIELATLLLGRRCNGIGSICRPGTTTTPLRRKGTQLVEKTKRVLRI
jgi:hypothetical protein